MKENLKLYLQPTRFIDSDSPEVIKYARRHTNEKDTPVEKAIKLYYAVRDGFRYNPYYIDLSPDVFKASLMIKKESGYCTEKANLLSAACRALGIPARLAFANVRNHIAVEKLTNILKTDVMVFHGYSELYLDGKWVKATPAFNRLLCEKLNVAPLEFNGLEDSVFQQFNEKGGYYMEYLHNYGHFADMPHELFVNELRKYYSHLFTDNIRYPIVNMVK